MKKISVFLLLCVLGACTITKRVHNSGWHVQWKSSASAGNEQTNRGVSDDKRSQLEATKETGSITQTEDENSSAMLKSSALNSREELVSMTDSPSANKTDEAYAETSSQNERVSPIKQSLGNQDDGVDNRKIHPYLFVSFGFFMGSVLSIILLVCGIFEVLIGILLLMLFLIAFFGFLSFIFAVIANREIKKFPELWKGESGAKALVIFGIMFSLGAVVVAVGLWILLLSILSLFL
jgi:hypothetical protein